MKTMTRRFQIVWAIFRNSAEHSQYPLQMHGSSSKPPRRQRTMPLLCLTPNAATETGCSNMLFDWIECAVLPISEEQGGASSLLNPKSLVTTWTAMVQGRWHLLYPPRSVKWGSLSIYRGGLALQTGVHSGQLLYFFIGVCKQNSPLGRTEFW